MELIEASKVNMIKTMRMRSNSFSFQFKHVNEGKIAYSIEDILNVGKKLKFIKIQDKIIIIIRLLKEDKNLEIDDELADEFEEKMKISSEERKTLLVLY